MFDIYDLIVHCLPIATKQRHNQCQKIYTSFFLGVSALRFTFGGMRLTFDRLPLFGGHYHPGETFNRNLFVITGFSISFLLVTLASLRIWRIFRFTGTRKLLLSTQSKGGTVKKLPTTLPCTVNKKGEVE